MGWRRTDSDKSLIDGVAVPVRSAWRMRFAWCALALASLPGCGNNPYPDGETAKPVLYLSLRDDPGTLDPSNSFTPAIVDNICPAYFQYRYLNRAGDRLELALGARQPSRQPFFYSAAVSEPRPDSLPGKEAESRGRGVRNAYHAGGAAQTVRRRGEIWTFRIKQGLRFQDDPCFTGGRGREIAASDFLYSFRRMADPDVNSPWLSFFDDKILGLHAYVTDNRKRISRKLTADYAAPVEGLETVAGDPYAFRIRLNQPFPQLRYLMAMRLTTPQAWEATARYGKEIARHPVGCGPYRVAEYRSKQRIVLVRNANYRAEVYPADGSSEDRAAGLMADYGSRLVLTRRRKMDYHGWQASAMYL